MRCGRKTAINVCCGGANGAPFEGARVRIRDARALRHVTRAITKRSAWPEFRPRELRALSFNRQGERKPTQDRAAVPHAAPEISGRDLAGSIRGGNSDRTPEHAGIPA